MSTAADVITEGLRLLNVVDQMETAQPADIQNGVAVLNHLLRNEMADGACQFLIKMATATLPAGVAGQVYTFTIGAGTNFTVNADAVAMRQLFIKDVGLTVNRETRPAPKADVIRTTYPSMINRWHQERQIDGSILVTAGQPPRTAVTALIEYGGRIPALTAADGSDTVGLPPEGIADAVLLFMMRVAESYGKTPGAVIAAQAAAVDQRWRGWARGQQWLRYVRA
jgi:hypothetical protein